MSGWTIYWITRLDRLHGAAIFTATIAFALLSFVTIFLAEGDVKSLLKIGWYRATVVVLAASTLAATMIPSTREMAAILVIPAVANSETTKELGSGLIELAQEWTKNQLEAEKAK